MATAGTFTGGRSGSEPWLTLHWQRIATDIANNRSTIRLTLRLHSQYNIDFSSPKSGVLHGSSYTYSGGMKGTNLSRVVRTRDVVITHNSDGQKSQSFSGSLNLQIWWNASNRTIGNVTVSGTANIDRIPRASTISSFSNFTVRNGQSNSFSLKLTRASTGFTHNITLRVNGEDIQSWNGQGLPTSLSLSQNSSERILNIMRNATSMTAQLRVQTRSGSTNIGGVVTRNATVSVHSAIAPIIDSVSITEDVANIRTGLGVYVQGKSRLKISFTHTIGYGARDGSFSVTFEGRTYNSKSFTTNTITGTGTRPIVITYTNTRGQKVTRNESITAYAYANPKPTISRAYRVNANGTENEDGDHGRVNYAGTISSLNGKNTAKYYIRYRPSNDSGYTEVEVSSSGNYVFPADIDYAYDVQFQIEDFFTSIMEYRQIFSTFSLINFSADGRGMAFGQTYDDSLGGTLQIKGEIHFETMSSTRLPEGTNLNNVTGVGFYYESTNARAETMSNLPVNRAFSLWVEQHAGRKQTFTQYDAGSPRTWIRNQYSGAWGAWKELQFV